MLRSRRRKQSLALISRLSSLRWTNSFKKGWEPSLLFGEMFCLVHLSQNQPQGSRSWPQLSAGAFPKMGEPQWQTWVLSLFLYKASSSGKVGRWRTRPSCIQHCSTDAECLWSQLCRRKAPSASQESGRCSRTWPSFSVPLPPPAHNHGNDLLSLGCLQPHW